MKWWICLTALVLALTTSAAAADLPAELERAAPEAAEDLTGGDLSGGTGFAQGVGNILDRLADQVGDVVRERTRGAAAVLLVVDWGVHMLDQIMMMVEKPLRSVYAILSHVTNDDVDDGFKIFLDFEGGLNVQVEVGTSNFINLPRWYMQGNNGTAVMPDWFAENGRIVMVSDWENRDAVPVVTAAGLTKTMAPRTDDTILEYPLPVLHSDVRDFYRNVAKAIRGEEAQLVTHEQVMKVMKVMEAAFRSADTNQVVTDIF